MASIAAMLLLNIKPAHQQSEFQQWKAQHGKTYDSAIEESYRERVFRQNLAQIEAHNSDVTQTYQKGVNQFADMTQEEFVAQHLTLKVNRKYENIELVDLRHPLGDIDWNATGSVTDVKNQGQCGSCWAFAAVAAMESALIIKQKGAVNLAEQQLVDCSGAYGNYGCNGGWMDSAFQYIIDHGITETTKYPYVARDQTCQIDSGAWKLSGFVDTPGCDNLANALNIQPVSVAVDASNWSFYRSGVFSNCGVNVNHGVLLVALTDAFWTIKNSWATTWGEAGFIRLARGNTCAICAYPSYPVL